MRVATYRRRSTDETLQADSLNAQLSVLTAYAARHGHEIVDASFVDSASGRSADRDGFRRLIDTVERGAPFEAVLVRDVTRWGRFANVDESAFWEFYFQLHGVRVIYVEEGFQGRDGAGALQKMFRRFVAAEFSREKARLVQYAQFRAVNNGYRLGGDPPYGMVRVLIRPDGSTVQVLRRGERKVMNDQRVKLAAGDPAHVRVVRRIYRLCVGGKTTGQIAAILNRDRIPSARGVRWIQESIRKILTNPAYVGTTTATFRASENFDQTTVAARANAWPAIIAQQVWEAAQERISNQRWRKTPDGLAQQLRAFFERHGRLDERCIGRPTPDTFRKYFDQGSEEALRRAYADEVAAAVDEVKRTLAANFSVDATGETVMLDGSLRVGFKVGFPRGHRLGGIHWRFRFDGTEDQDVTVGIAMGSGAVSAALYFHIVNARFKRKARVLAPRTHSTTTKTRARSLEQLVRGLKRDLLRYSAVAKLRFWEAIRGLPLVNTYAAARGLGWKEDAGLPLYRRLQREGYAVPPLQKQPGRRITIVCDDCGLERTMLVSNAMQHSSSLCAACVRARQAKYSTCPDCNRTRRLKHGELSRLKDGSNSRCRPCSSRHNAQAITGLRARDHRGRFVAGRREVEKPSAAND